MFVLSLNLGLKSVRAIVFDTQGNTVVSAALPITTTLRGIIVEQSADEWWTKLCSVIGTVAEDKDVARQITIATVACSASCLIAVDAHGKPTAPVMMVSDRRAEDEAASIQDGVEFQRLSTHYEVTVSSMSQVPRMLWLKRHNADAFARTRKMLAPNDYLVRRLTGSASITDPLNAEKSFYVRDQNDYAKSVFEEIGISTDLLPDVRPIGHVVGHIAPEVAGQLGLSDNVQVHLSTYDAICSVFGTGLHEEGMASDVSGTVTSVRLRSNRALADERRRVFCQYFDPADCYLIGGSNNLGGGLIEWAKQCFYSDEVHPYEVMEKEARASSVGAKGLILLPYLLGARAPHWNGDARGVFFGLERYHGRGDMARAVFESVAFEVRQFTEIFQAMNCAPTMMTASGGLARVSLVNEVKADIVGVPYHVMEEFESTGLGAAIIALVASGVYPTYEAAAHSMVRTRQIVLPKASHTRIYDDFFALYRRVHADLEHAFSMRQALVQRDMFRSIEHIDNL